MNTLILFSFAESFEFYYYVQVLCVALQFLILKGKKILNIKIKLLCVRGPVTCLHMGITHVYKMDLNLNSLWVVCYVEYES